MSLGLFFLLSALLGFNVLLFCGGGRFVVPTEDDATEHSYQNQNG